MASAKYIGLNLSHDASVSFHDEEFRVLFAMSEERVSRKKGHYGFPLESLQVGLEDIELASVQKIVIGSHGTLELTWNVFLIDIFQEDYPPGFEPNKSPRAFPIPPGFLSMSPITTASLDNQFGKLEYARSWNQLNSLNEIDKKNWIREKIKRLLPFDVSESDILFNNHHNSHCASAVFPSGFKDALVMSLDGSGDGDWGLVQDFRSGRVHRDLNRFHMRDSLGLLYSEITKRYNFRANRHEGKVTGLASHGSFSSGFTYLDERIQIRNDQIRINLPRNRYSKEILLIVNRLLGKKAFCTSIAELVDLATARTSNYADLAWAGQKILEKYVLELVKIYLDRTGHSNLALAGGVFSNVRLNQLIAESLPVDNIFIYPDMGDAGLAAGGIWSFGAKEIGLLPESTLMPSIYLGSKGNREISQHEFIATTFENESQCVTSLVEDFAAGKVIGTIIGRIEVGPRALCNRSILALPNDASLNATLNRKLNRTEFMPFAPVVRDIDFSEFFEWRGSSKVIDFNSRDFHSPFRFMTMTCEVVKGMRKLIPAVVHVDGTARPQVVTETENPFMYHLLTRMKGQGLLPILVNTSFNAHEEPIILDLQSGLEELRRGSIDVLITDGLKKFTLDK